MKDLKKEELLDIAERYAISIKNKNGELDVILGHNEHILGSYKRDHVKLKGGWYYRNISTNVDFLSAVIEKYKITQINFIGASKSCSGCVILSKGLIRKKFPSLKMKLFMFSAYTTVDRDVYVKRNIEEKAPGTLKSLWESKWYTDKLIREMETRRLIGHEDIEIYLFFPGRSKYGESQLARRLEGENLHHIELPVYMHNTLYPMWKEVDGNRTIEVYENEFKEMHKDDYAFYSTMQEYENFNFHLYSCLEDPQEFMKRLNTFISNYKGSK